MKYKDLVPKKSEIGVCERFYNDGKFNAYHERHMMARLIKGYEESEIAVINPDCVNDSGEGIAEMEYARLSMDTEDFHLYVKGN